MPAQTIPAGVSLSAGSAPAAADRLGAERRRVVAGDRRLVGGGSDVAGEHARVRVVEDRRLDAPAEELVRLAHEELVERVLGGDEHREPVAAATRAAPLLTQGCNRPGEADGDHRVQQADVNTELERIRGGDAEQLPVGEPPLDLSSLVCGVAGAIRREAAVVAEPFGGETVDQLGRLAAFRERQRAQASIDEHRLQPRCFGERGGP